MKASLLLISIILGLLTSCAQEQKPENGSGSFYNNSQTLNETAFYGEGQYGNEEPREQKNTNNSNNSGFRYYKQMSQEFGIPIGGMLIPTTWYESNNTAEGILFEGPNGVKIFRAQSNSHYYSNDQNMNQIMAQNGSSVQAPKEIGRFISEDLSTHMANEGYQFTSQYPLPQLAQFDTRFDSYLFKATPEQKEYQCMVTEWKDRQGNPAMVIVRYYVAYYQIGGMDWGYTLNAMVADRVAYENTKNSYISALVNYEINPQWVNANNQYWAQVAQQQNAGHQQRMADIQAQGQAILQQGRANSAMMDRNHEQFMNNLRSDGGHSDFIDYIRDEQNVTNTYDGQTYKVESGSNYYWMNSNGEYLQTDNPNWNPNTDPAYNNQNWNLTTGNK